MADLATYTRPRDLEQDLPSSQPPGPNNERAVVKGVLLAAALVVAGLVFRELVVFAIALVLSVIFAVLLAACADRLERLKIPRPIGALVGLLVALAFWAGVLVLAIPPFSHEMSVLAQSAPRLIGSAESQIHHLTGISTASLGTQAQDSLQKLVANPAQLLGTLASVTRGAGETVGALVLISLSAYYMAVRPRPLVSGLLRLFPVANRPDAQRILGRIHTAWFGWCRGLLLDMLITGSLTYLALFLVGVPFAFVLAVLTAVLLVVPFFGAVISGVPAVLLALTISPGKALITLIVFLLIHQIEGNVIAPLVMGRSINLHPALLAFGVVILGALFGPVGLIVAVPLLSLAAVLVEELWMRPFDKRTATSVTPG